MLVERIEFVKSWQAFRPGQVADGIPPGVRLALLRRGIAKPAPVAETPPPSEPPPTTPVPKPKKGK